MSMPTIKITDKATINRVLYWLNYRPSTYNPTVKTSVQNGAIVSVTLTAPKYTPQFYTETDDVLLNYYLNNNINNLPPTPKESTPKNLKTTKLLNLNEIDHSNHRYRQQAIFAGPQKTISFNLKNKNNTIFSSLLSQTSIGTIVTQSSLSMPCDCETCYGVCCRPSGINDIEIIFTGNITDPSIECDDIFSIHYHKANNALDAIAETNIASWLSDNGWVNITTNDTSSVPSCVSSASFKVSARCYGDLDYTSQFNMPPLSSGQAEISWNNNICACIGNGDRVFDENITQNICEDIGGTWFPLCASDSCEIQAITNVTLSENNLSFDISTVVLPTGSKDLDIIPILIDIDNTYNNKIGFNVGIGNLNASSSGQIIIPITGCDNANNSELVQFSPQPSEIMIITNVSLNTTNNPGLIFDVISVSGTIDNTVQKNISLQACNL